MKSAQYDSIGDASDVLRIVDVPMPTPAAGEVLVRLVTSGVNPSDVKTRSGHIPSSWPFPRVPHSDGAGIIAAVGAGVHSRRIGERVWLFNTAWGRVTGTAAEYVVVPEDFTSLLPAEVSFETGACLGIPASTALHALTLNGSVEGKSVLIAGGAGAVGNYAIQFARILGAAQILTTVSGDEKAKWAEQAGADVVINYKADNTLQSIQDATSGRGVDLILEVDLSTNIDLDVSSISREGRIVAYGSSQREFKMPFSRSILKNIGYDFFILYHINSKLRKSISAKINDIISKNKIIHNIAEVFPLDKISEAHKCIESGKIIGNVIVKTI